MASSRTSRSRSRGGSSRRRSSASSSNNNQMIVVGAVIGLAALIGVFFLVGNNNGKGPDKKDDVRNSSVQARNAVADKQTPSKPVPAVGEGKKGKTPDRPAPNISEESMREAEALYDEAKKLDIQARKAQKVGKSGDFNRLINDAWDKLEVAFQKLQAYDEWLDEAVLEDWAIPAQYVAFQSRIRKLEKLQGRIKRIRPMRRGK